LSVWHEPADEPTCERRFDFGFEAEESMEGMRRLIVEEVESFRRMVSFFLSFSPSLPLFLSLSLWIGSKRLTIRRCESIGTTFVTSSPTTTTATLLYISTSKCFCPSSSTSSTTLRTKSSTPNPIKGRDPRFTSIDASARGI